MKKLVLDIGGTLIKYAVMNKEAKIFQRGELPTPLDSIESLMKKITELYNSLKDEVNGIAISMPGNIDTKTGQIYSPGALTYNANVNIVDKIQEHINVPVSVENDGKSAALAEVWMGNLKNFKDGVVMILGTGIGGGIIKDRKIHKGNNFFAGEFSFILQDAKELDFNSAFALTGSTSALINEVSKKKNIDIKDLNGYKVFSMIEEKDSEVLEIFEKFTTNIAIQIYNLQCILDPEKFLIGGGISKQPILLEKIKENLEKIYEKIPFDIPHAVVDTCKHYNDSNLIGALYNYYLQFPED
ncbi:ROK family protein [uncultured Clostridium sp.]|uniref:ROK family protein n=1 Tax=uncultured Clostridium sp. TaxID=59620 RepID=UPI0025901678|nr:ROK family protein [uncultured Clostridium sp.]